MKQFFNYTFLNNTIINYILFLLTLVISFFLIKIVMIFLIKHVKEWSQKSENRKYDSLINLIQKKIMPILYFTAFYFCTKILNIHPTITKIIAALTLAVTAIIIAILLSSISIIFVGKYFDSKVNSANSKILLKWTSSIIQVIIYTIALILFLDNMGVKITSLITGLGIGGVAIAFAAQTILVDLFCCFTILFDKPFEIGDFIVSGEQMGTVEHIGIKTTRLRALSGEQLIFANSDLTNSRINNYKTMDERRVLFKIGVTYDTKYEELTMIPELIKNIIDSVKDTRFGRAHFSSYGPYSLNFEIAYYVLSNDYDKYMDINQAVNYQIKKIFDQHGISFAFPTQTIQIENTSLAGDFKLLNKTLK